MFEVEEPHFYFSVQVLFFICCFRKYRLFRKGMWAQNGVQRNTLPSSLKVYLSVSLKNGEGKAASGKTCGSLIPRSFYWNGSNNFTCESTTENLASNCHRYLRRQRLFQNTDVKSYWSCSVCRKQKGYVKRIIRIHKKLQMKVGKNFSVCLTGMCQSLHKWKES